MQSSVVEEIIQENTEQYEESASPESRGDVHLRSRALTLGQGTWLKGDLHAHSTYSDGDSSVAAVIPIAEGYGLDFFALTDHNTSAQWSDTAYRSSKLTLLYGTEWTTPSGHANIWTSEPYDYESVIRPTLALGSQAAIVGAHSLRAAGIHALFSINHPDDPVSNPWEYPFAQSRDADCMEAWNGGYTWPSLSLLVIDGIYQDYWRQGARLCMLGGSDSHTHLLDNPETYYNDIGMPTTWVLAKSRSAADILDGLKDGVTFISSSSDGAELRFSASSAQGPTLMGQPLPASALGQKVTFTATIANARSFLGGAFPFSLAVVMKNGQPLRFTLSASSDYSFSCSDKPAAGDYYYARLIQLPSSFSIRLLGQLLQIGWVKALSSPVLMPR